VQPAAEATGATQTGGAGNPCVDDVSPCHRHRLLLRRPGTEARSKKKDLSRRISSSGF
jgi:hypothetical protein